MADIYADPVISRIATVYPTNKPINTIPKVQVTATIRNTDGTTKTYLMPRAQYLIRGAAENVVLSPNVSNNLFTMSVGYPHEVNPTLARINKRYFIVRSVTVFGLNTVDDTTSLTEVGLNLRPDARGQIHKEFDMIDRFGNEVAGTIIGHIDWDKGVVTYSVTFSTVPNMTYQAEFMNGKVVFSPRKGEVGRTKINIKQSGWDVNIDVKEDFEIELETETIQD